MIMVKNTEKYSYTDIFREVTTNHKTRLNYNLSKNTFRD